VWLFEKKTQLASVSVRINSKLRVWVTGSGPMEEGSSRYIVPGPDSYGRVTISDEAQFLTDLC